jgi:hypothetical protein
MVVSTERPTRPVSLPRGALFREPEPWRLVGSELLHGTLVRGWWIAQLGVTLSAVAVYRVGLPLRLALRHRVRGRFSTRQAGSEISRLRAGTLASARCAADVHEVIHLCAQARVMTAGWFDPWAMPGGFDPTGLVKGWAARRASTMLLSHVTDPHDRQQLLALVWPIASATVIGPDLALADALDTGATAGELTPGRVVTTGGWPATARLLTEQAPT